MEIPFLDGSSPPCVPARIRRRLTETKASLSTVEEIEAKLRNADLRRQKLIKEAFTSFYTTAKHSHNTTPLRDVNNNKGIVGNMKNSFNKMWNVKELYC
nr:T-complex protein 11 [Tanacetum cinerariifolium]